MVLNVVVLKLRASGADKTKFIIGFSFTLSYNSERMKEKEKENGNA